ncbi:MAG: magnesium transporter [Gammaproteobacteria bacterium]
MVDNTEKNSPQQRLEILHNSLQTGSAEQVRRLLGDLHPAEIADLIESLPHGPRELIWELVPGDIHGAILLEVNEEVRASLIGEMEISQLISATENMNTDDLADLVYNLPRTIIHELLLSMDKQNRNRLETVLSYPENTAGGLMDLDIITVRQTITLDVVLRYLRLRGEIPDLTDSLIVVNRLDQFQGLLPLTTLLTNDPELSVADVMDTTIDGIPHSMADIDVARLFQDHDLISAPVINDDGKLLGRITIDDVVDVIREEADHSLMSMAGLDEDNDIFAPVITSAGRRALWLGLNLATAFIAAWVIGLFENTLEKVVALAILMPIVASMGGIAGSQTLTIMIRGLALGQVGAANSRSLMYKEILVSLMNGLIWSIVVAAVTIIWFQRVDIGLIIGAALIINLLCASIAGFSIPLILKRAGIDPALAGGVLLTTVTDVVGFTAFLGLGALYLT